LRSRFEWGLIADLQPPDLETKIAILKRKAEYLKVDLPIDVALFMASQMKGDIRQLEGALKTVVAHSSLMQQEITIDAAHEALRILLAREEKLITIEMVQKAVADYFRIEVPTLKSKSRSKPLAFSRQVAMYLSRAIARASLSDIGRSFGDRDHTTVLYAYNKVSEMMEQDEVFRGMIERLITILKG